MKKMMFLFALCGLLVTGCASNEDSEKASSEKKEEHYTSFKSYIIDYDAEGTGSSSSPTGLITVIIDGEVHVFDVEYDNYVDGDYSPIKFENNLHTIKGAYLYGQMNQDGELRNARVKSK